MTILLSILDDSLRQDFLDWVLYDLKGLAITFFLRAMTVLFFILFLDLRGLYKNSL